MVLYSERDYMFNVPTVVFLHCLQAASEISNHYDRGPLTRPNGLHISTIPSPSTVADVRRLRSSGTPIIACKWWTILDTKFKANLIRTSLTFPWVSLCRAARLLLSALASRHAPRFCNIRKIRLLQFVAFALTYGLYAFSAIRLLLESLFSCCNSLSYGSNKRISYSLSYES